MTEVLLVRHGHPVSGAADPTLSTNGRNQAVRLGRRLAVEQVDVVVTSPLARARETATIAAEAIGRPVEAVLDDLREWDLDHNADGLYVALEDLGAGNPRAEALRSGRYEDFVPPINRDEFLGRARRALDEIFDRWPGKRVVAVSHGGLINAALATFLGNADNFFFFVPDYTSVSTVREMPGGRRVVHALNSVRHLVRDAADLPTATHSAPLQPVL